MPLKLKFILSFQLYSYRTCRIIINYRNMIICVQHRYICLPKQLSFASSFIKHKKMDEGNKKTDMRAHQAVYFFYHPEIISFFMKLEMNKKKNHDPYFFATTSTSVHFNFQLNCCHAIPIKRSMMMMPMIYKDCQWK